MKLIITHRSHNIGSLSYSDWRRVEMFIKSD